MVVRIASMALRILFVLNLLLGIGFWTGILGGGWVLVHMLIGLLFVACIWLLGLAQGLTKSGNLGLVFGTFLVGLIIVIFGVAQSGIIVGDAHWITQIIHILLAIAGIGIGEASASRYRRGTAATAASAS